MHSQSTLLYSILEPERIFLESRGSYSNETEPHNIAVHVTSLRLVLSIGKTTCMFLLSINPGHKRFDFLCLNQLSIYQFVLEQTSIEYRILRRDTTFNLQRTLTCERISLVYSIFNNSSNLYFTVLLSKYEFLFVCIYDNYC